ncbi:MAG: hypothetical protein COY40_00275 [Alphaproteobacteria bacterium CG_4_10_14_0_8_um_filter_53_9]|nr:MAG: hypothetical protein COY40_00275 [Alphaproteobacteria bacterium CG_4_10_14_0_8_um_filter_53_9]
MRYIPWLKRYGVPQVASCNLVVGGAWITGVRTVVKAELMFVLLCVACMPNPPQNGGFGDFWQWI